MIETNAVTRTQLVKNPNLVFDIFNANDLLKAAGLTAQITAPDGVLRTPLVLNGLYYIHEFFVWPKILYPETITTNTINTVSLIGARPGVAMQVDGANDDIPIFWGRNMNAVHFEKLTIFDVGNSGAGHSAYLFDFVGGAQAAGLTTVEFQIIQVSRIGEIVDMIENILPNTDFVSNRRGLISDTTPFSLISSPHKVIAPRCINSFNKVSSGPCFGYTGPQTTITIPSGNVDLAAADEYLRIDESATGTFDILGTSYNGVGELFSTGANTANILYANADLVINSFSDSTVNPGVDTTVNLAVITKFRKGQLILIADEAAYNGERQIVRVAADQLSFDINVVFSTAGAATLKQTLVTANDNDVMQNESITIAGTVAYNGQHQVNLLADDNYEIPFAFVTAEVVGTTTSTPNNERSVGVNASLNGDAVNSRRIAFGNMNGNTAVTTITAVDTYTDLNLVSFINDSIVSSRFTLTNAVTGEYTYTDPRPITANIRGLIWLLKTGSTESYRIACKKNGVAPVFTESITSVTDSSGVARFNFTAPPTLTVGSKIVIKGYTTNTAYNGEFIIDTVGAGFFEVNSIAFGTGEAGGEFEDSYSPVEVKTAIEGTSYNGFIDIVQNDTLQLTIAGEGNTDNPTITDFKLEITG